MGDAFRAFDQEADLRQFQNIRFRYKSDDDTYKIVKIAFAVFWKSLQGLFLLERKETIDKHI
jgi:hypothetical protein